MIDIYYPSKLLQVLNKTKSPFIPKKVPEKQNYIKLYHKYYSEDFMSDSYFKVIDSFNIDNEIYGVLNFNDDIYWTIPIEKIDTSNMYELVYDNNNIINTNIINSENSYNGYIIKYWFFKNYHSILREFKPYIEDNGYCSISDYNKYFISATYINHKYTNIKLTIDRRRR